MFPLWLVIIIIFFFFWVWLLIVKTDKTSFTIVIMFKKKKKSTAMLSLAPWGPYFIKIDCSLKITLPLPKKENLCDVRCKNYNFV